VSCFGGLFLERIPAHFHFRTFGAKHLSRTHSPLCKNKVRVLVLFLFAHYFVITRYNLYICVVCVFLWLLLVSLCLWLYSVEVCNPTFPLNLSLQVFFSLLVEPSLVFNRFFQSCKRSVACPPGISVLDVQVLETSNVLAYIIFCCVVLEILCLFSELCCVFALDCAQRQASCVRNLLFWLGPIAWTGEEVAKLVHVMYRRAALVVL
jgi:hypothetical protein